MEYMESRMQDQIEGAQRAHEEAMIAGMHPAFPTQEQIDCPSNSVMQYYPGVTVRDYFAAKAMQAEEWGLPHLHGKDAEYDRLATHAYRMADAMLLARAK